MYDLTVAGTKNFNTYTGIAGSDTFHMSGTGIGTSMKGVGRIKELLNVSKSPKGSSMTIYLRHPANASPEAAKLVLDGLKATHLRDIVLESSILYDRSDFKATAAEDLRIAKLYAAFDLTRSTPEDSPWLLRLRLDRARMEDSGVRMLDVHRVASGAFFAGICASDDAAADLVVRLRPPTSEGADMVAEMTAFEDAVLGLRVRGVDRISNAVIENVSTQRYDGATGAFVTDTEWCVRTAGSNFEGAMTVAGVDARRVLTDDVCQVYRRLGVEAARAALLKELVDTYSGATYADFRHVALLADFMTQRGDVSPITRHGMNSSDVGPLAKCSYEETVLRLATAGAWGEADQVDGVSANIMLGQVAPCGTGDSTIVMDLDMLGTLEGPRASAASSAPDDGASGLSATLDALLAFDPYALARPARPWLDVKASAR
jgi:DNA-directed RNA polymerase II subunit RPB1